MMSESSNEWLMRRGGLTDCAWNSVICTFDRRVVCVCNGNQGYGELLRLLVLMCVVYFLTRRDSLIFHDVRTSVLM